MYYEGKFYKITRCPAEYTPDPIDVPAPEIYVAGVNPFNLRLTGHLRDGLHVHPVHSSTYISETVIPDLETGTDIGDRSVEDVMLPAQVFVIIGSGTERETTRETVRKQIGFYGSTRTYRTIFDVHDWSDIWDVLHNLAAAGR